MAKSLTDAQDDIPELTAEDMSQMRPFAEMFPELADSLVKRKRGQRGPGKGRPKRQISLRIDADVIERYRHGGPGWQVRMNDALRAALDEPKDRV
jgi:uncharacterized protein (DUF4415 family)